MTDYGDFKDLIIVLADDALPQKGDIVKWHNPSAFDCFNFRYQEVVNDKPPHPDNEYWIIQRSGKPVIYASQL